jgi:hypothetical protein
MNTRQTLFLPVTISIVLLILMVANPTVVAEDETAIVKFKDLTFDFDVRIDSTNATAIVAAKIKEDETSTGQWPCRLIHHNPNLPVSTDIEAHVTPGSILALVNHTPGDATFTFNKYVFVEEKLVFTVKQNGIKLLRVREDASIKIGDDPEKYFKMESTGCTNTLPGPVILIP